MKFGGKEKESNGDEAGGVRMKGVLGVREEKGMK